ncbi:MAG: hypothetical protein JST59_01890 [Actinobacteria bacterium]|nr:hypothetical protein [Actinomycetota bacterium]
MTTVLLDFLIGMSVQKSKGANEFLNGRFIKGQLERLLFVFLFDLNLQILYAQVVAVQLDIVLSRLSAASILDHLQAKGELGVQLLALYKLRIQSDNL